MWNNTDPHSLPMGTQNGRAVLGDSLAVSYHILLPHNPEIALPAVNPKELKIGSTQKPTRRFLEQLSS